MFLNLIGWGYYKWIIFKFWFRFCICNMCFGLNVCLDSLVEGSIVLCRVMGEMDFFFERKGVENREKK